MGRAVVVVPAMVFSNKVGVLFQIAPTVAPAINCAKVYGAPIAVFVTIEYLQ